MAPSADSGSGIEASYRGWIAACNDGGDLAKFLHSTYQHDGKTYTPETWAEYFATVKEALGPIHFDIDYVVVDEDAQCVATRLLTTTKPQKPWMGLTPAGQEVSYAEMHFVWFNNGKMSKLASIIDDAAVAKQLADADAKYDFCSAKEVTPSATPLDTAQLEKVYDEFVAAINDRTMKEKFPEQIHDTISQNERVFTRDQFIMAMEGIMFAMPDVRATIRTKLVNTEAQRIIVQLELAGTMIKPIAGFEPTGRPVAFNEHVMYQWVDGRIARNWVLLDFATMGKQLKGDI